MITTEIQIRFADVDRLGHVNNIHIQQYFDLGKSDLMLHTLGLRDAGGSQGLIVASVTSNYLHQTLPGANVRVETFTESIGNKSLVLAQRLVDTTTGQINAESRSVMVAFDFLRQEPIPVPPDWRTKLLPL